MVVKKKTPPYTPIGESISVETAFVQAATALDVAAAFAVESRDAIIMAQIAQVWVEMGAHLIRANGEDDSDNEEDLTSQHPLGFESSAMTALRKEKENARIKS